MQVSQLWRYPVKSMVGGEVDSIELDELGIVGDRTWAVRDLERGGIRGAKKIGSLMRLAATDVDGGHVEITLPDGSTVRTTDADVDERVSAALDHRVRLERLRPADDLEHYRRGAPDSDDVVAELRGIFGREDDEHFRPVVGFENATVLYLTDEYEQIIEEFLEESRDLLWERIGFLRTHMPIDPGHWDGWNIVTGPQVGLFEFQPGLHSALVYFSILYEGGQSTLVKDGDAWKLIESQLTWIE